jgi:hypothetical protein
MATHHYQAAYGIGGGASYARGTYRNNFSILRIAPGSRHVWRKSFEFEPRFRDWREFNTKEFSLRRTRSATDRAVRLQTERIANDIADALEARGILESAETAGVQRRMIIMMARMIIMLTQHLKLKERPDFDQAMRELQHALDIAVDVKQHGVPDTNEEEFVNNIVAVAQADSQFAMGAPEARLTMTGFGMVLRLNHSETTRLCDAMQAGQMSTATITAIIAALGITEPAAAIAALVSAILSLGATTLKASDSASKGIVVTVLWVGLPWCKTQ